MNYQYIILNIQKKYYNQIINNNLISVHNILNSNINLCINKISEEEFKKRKTNKLINILAKEIFLKIKKKL